MKKINFPVVSAALVILLASSGCTKAYDYLLTRTDAIVPARIDQFISLHLTAPNFNDTIIFKYNALGDPVSATRDDPATGAPNFLFQYDKWDRLTDYIGVYSDTNSGEYWHRYYYYGTGKDRYTIDTTYNLFNRANGILTHYFDMQVRKFKYDSKDRVNEITYYSGADSVAATLQYDTAGNLMGATHDNKINFHRTNKVWMFIDLNYSVNNSFTALAYNSWGLPTSLQAPGEQGQGNFVGIFYFAATIQYSPTY